MSQSLEHASRAGLRDAAVGFYGKIPTRADFVGAGLPRSFVEAWDDWMQQMLSSSHEKLGDEWRPAWLEAAIWRFALAPGLCGPAAVLGLWMPSVDKVGRHFPLALAAVVPDAALRELIDEGGGFLIAAERAGLSALERDLSPADLSAALAAASCAERQEACSDPPPSAQTGTFWWTEGAPRVPPATLFLNALPDNATFANMLDARAGDGLR
jgi:type VI secretion system protein ImpM